MNASLGRRGILGSREERIAREVHQVLRELAVGICCPSIGSDANYHHSASCQLPPVYVDRKIGKILISVDYMAEVGGVYTQREMYEVLYDFEGTCDKNMNEDPIYNPNVQEKESFMKPADNMLFKLTLVTTQVEQHGSVFRFDALNGSSNVGTASDLRGGFGPNFKCQHFQYAQDEYFYVHAGTEFDVSTPSVQGISLKVMILVCHLSCKVCVYMSLHLIKYERIL
ncbi:LOW QUALITY PROTEIN: ankyrin and armadillo repeat-containing protein [Pterocles gutturalis]